MATSDYYDVLDPRFARLFNGNARVEKLYSGCLWAEGPAWFGAGRFLIWSDIPNNRMLRYDETSGAVSVFRQPANNSNGNTVDRMGRLVTCEHGGRRVSRTEHDGRVITLADNYQGKRLNSPNDVVVKSDGIDPATGAVDAVITDMVKPNGIAFSRDERQLYVVDTGRTHGPQNPKHMRVFDVSEDNKVSTSRVFAECSAGLFDGFRLDSEGRIWTSAADGIHCYDPDGTLIGKVLVPEVVANCVFGGIKRNVLYICGTTSLYAVRLMVNGHATY
jgi:gluconolactonase